jgi:glycosyltransferase involved in cell wall biosynthesis
MSKDLSKKIIIITNQPFPLGLAGTNRILSYCKGFIHHGYQPEVICIRPTERYNNIINHQASGIYEGIRYTYPGRTSVRVKSFWGRRQNDVFAVISSILFFTSVIKKKDVSFSIFYGNNFLAEIFFIYLSRVFKKKFYKEESENPHVYFNQNRSAMTKIFEWFYISKLYKLYSGVLVMTHPLREFFISMGVPDRKILIVPHTVDPERFKNRICDSTLILPDNYVAYLGSINQQKDGILTLVNSFIKVVEKYPEMHLVIAGAGSEEEKNELIALINQLKLDETVHYLGRISSGEIPALFNGAKLLVSCRTKSYQNEYSFPTKVVEYLATGIPVVTTTPGELAFYLKDKENAFVADVEDPDLFSSKILEALQDYDFAMKVGQNGKMLVNDKFNPIIQTKMAIDFCKTKYTTKAT